jgi:hypothetical protein
MNFALALMASAAFFLAGMGTASAAPEFKVSDESWARVDGDKMSEPPTPNGAQDTGRGWIFWLFADPEDSSEAAGAEKGMYFFELVTGRYSFLPYGEGIMSVNMVHFNPDGSRFIIESVLDGVGDAVNIEVFDFDTLTKLFATGEAALSPFWIDSDRFAYSGLEPGTDRGRGEDELNQWVSLFMRAVGAGETVTLKKATDTRNFLLLAADDTQIAVSVEYVQSPDDWAFPERLRNETVNVGVPPAK